MRAPAACSGVSTSCCTRRQQAGKAGRHAPVALCMRRTFSSDAACAPAAAADPSFCGSGEASAGHVKFFLYSITEPSVVMIVMRSVSPGESGGPRFEAGAAAAAAAAAAGASPFFFECACRVTRAVAAHACRHAMVSIECSVDERQLRMRCMCMLCAALLSADLRAGAGAGAVATRRCCATRHEDERTKDDEERHALQQQATVATAAACAAAAAVSQQQQQQLQQRCSRRHASSSSRLRMRLCTGLLSLSLSLSLAVAE